MGDSAGSLLYLTFPIVVQLQEEPVPCQAPQAFVRLWYSGTATVCWCTSGPQMYLCKEKQTQTEMTDCQLLGAYIASPTEQGGFIAACHLLESIHLDIRPPRCPRLVYCVAKIRLIQDSKKKQLLNRTEV